ncbi:MAG: ABC transporter ATP-binding protein [Candidatus Neomarinimicrobiota bacterium]|nr:MAG: ABC transporter ATP-binding protein [Candidatus Neomarinimicrobiota bacterium]RLI77065.1 MAG: ABC transporter ATP-binding protein [Archaeoglobales archaeon]
MTVIEVRNVSKKFRIPVERVDTVFERLLSLFSGGLRYREFWALRDVSFTVNEGEIFGIIGPNGGGKTTLLSIVAGILPPDSGEVRVKGKVVPILGLGIGFNPELSVRDNVIIYGTIMGLSRREIDRKFEDILGFAEIEEFSNAKLKTLSSGMRARIAFSTVINTEPDILIVDEVLTVGDVQFRKKCYRRLKEMNEEGVTILLVSHAPGMVKGFCDRVLLLNKRLIAIGDPGEVVRMYEKFNAKSPIK